VPTPYIEKLSKEGKGSVSDLEAKWNKAKGIAAKDGKSDDYAYITGIFKNMVGASVVIDPQKCRIQVMAATAPRTEDVVAAWKALALKLKATNPIVTFDSRRFDPTVSLSIPFKAGRISTFRDDVVLNFKNVAQFTPEQKAAIKAIGAKAGIPIYDMNFDYGVGEGANMSFKYPSTIVSNPKYAAALVAIYKLMNSKDNRMSPKAALALSRAQFIYDALKNTTEGRQSHMNEKPELKGEVAEFAFRDWGHWENPRDVEDEQDYDWQVMTEQTRAKLQEYMKKVAAKYPRVICQYSAEEKNWLHFTVRAK